MKLQKTTQPCITLELPLARWSTPMRDERGEFRELIAPDAFGDVIGGEVRLEHDKVLGSSAARTARVWIEDGKLCAVVYPGEHVVRDIAEMIYSGNDLGASPKFQVTDDEWTNLKSSRWRAVRKASLREISITTRPCYAGGVIQVHNL